MAEVTGLTRRTFIGGTGAVTAVSALGGLPVLAAAEAPVPARSSGSAKSMSESTSLKMSVKYGMVGGDEPMVEKFRLLKRLGFDGVEMDSPNDFSVDEVVAARDESGLMIHGVVDSIHWRARLSHQEESVRDEGRRGLETAIRDAKAYGGSSVLLVPGRVTDPKHENHFQVWRRSIREIRRVLPLAAELGIHILIENVWNGFCYEHDGPSDQSAGRLAAYLDEINSPWVGSYFDIGNHRKYANVEEWIHTLGRRIVKLDVKDWGFANGWSKIGDGDVNWPAVNEALAAIGYNGWCTAEVGGGGEDRLEDIKRRMDDVFGRRA